MRHKIRSRRRCGNGQLDNLFQLKQMRRSYARAGGADVESLGQFDEGRSMRVCAPQEDGDLDADAGSLPLLRARHRFLSL